MVAKAEILPRTLDLLILKAASLGAEHGYGVLLRIEQISGRALDIEQGASDNNRKATFYNLTVAGRKRLKAETERWSRAVLAGNTALRAQEA